MQDKIFRFIVKKIAYLHVFIAFSSEAQQNQDMPNFEDEEAPAAQIDMLEDEPGAATITDNEQTLPEPTEDQASDDEITSQNEGDAAQSVDFDVFRPSEEISEDLAVPFPADI